MPTYEYRCTSCGQHIEVVQSFNDDPLTECGSCGGALRKVFAPVGIVFKGSGFYKTDSRSSSRRDTAASKKDKDTSKEPAAAKSDGSSGSSGESSGSGSKSGDTKIA
ncbi:MAG: FmdB family zinc ribbon protein [Acidimicrobiia bacterium]